MDTLNLRIELAKHKIAYAGFRTELTVKNVQITGAKAMMEASEYTVLDLVVAGDDPLAPKTTEYVRDHLFTFVSQDNQWKLSSDQLLNVPGPVTSEEEGYMPIPAGIVPLKLELPPVSQDDQDDLGGGSEPRTLATLNRPAIVDYAYTYWDNYNSAYRDFSPNDCTNFISQAVRDGGWTDVPGWYRSTSAWWYNVTQSWTWINPHYWFWFTHDRPRGTPASNFTDLELGDILQIDFDRDGYMDHSMIVTYKDCYGTIYLTYHSNNTLNRSIWDIYNSHPNANYYGWCLLSSFD